MSAPARQGDRCRRPARQRRAPARHPRGGAQPAHGRRGAQARHAARARSASSRARPSRSAPRCSRGSTRSGLHANTTLLGEDVLSADEARAVVSQYEAILDGIAERGLRVNVALKLTHLGLLLDEELAYENVSAPRRPRGLARQLHPHRHGALGPRRPDARHLPAPARRRPRRGGHGAAGLPLPHARRPERAAAAATQPAPRQGRVPRAARGRLSAQGRRRRRVRATDRGHARGRRVHRDRDARRAR